MMTGQKRERVCVGENSMKDEWGWCEDRIGARQGEAGDSGRVDGHEQ